MLDSVTNSDGTRIGTIANDAKNQSKHDSKQYRVYTPYGKSCTICGEGGGVGAKTGLYAIPFENTGECATVQRAIPDIVDKKGYLPAMFNAYNRSEVCDKAPTLSTGSMVTSSCAVNILQKVNTNEHKYLSDKEMEYMVRSTKDGRNHFDFAYHHDGTKDKSSCVTANTHKGVPYNVLIRPVDQEPSGLPIYHVESGMITVHDQQYPIKLPDGDYIIRKLTPTECERLQTMPEGYTSMVSNVQRYRGLGNGWTAEVIIHILQGALGNLPRNTPIQVLSMYDGIGTGRYCLDKMGFTNVEYHAYEIDKYAMQVSMSNYPDIIQHGDAFQVREDDWSLTN